MELLLGLLLTSVGLFWSKPLEEKKEVLEVSGEIRSAEEGLRLPDSLVITWFNWLEQDDVRDGTAWRRTGGVSTIDAANLNFTLKMELGERQFAESITTSPKIKEWWQRFPEKAQQQMESMTFAMGEIYGVYGDRRNHEIRAGSEPGAVRDSRGPQDERAMADTYAVFYKRGTIDGFTIGRKTIYTACKWYSQLPQGFSCGRGVPADTSCDGDRWERYETVPCDQVVVKLAKRRCERGEKDLLNGNPGCFSGVNWT